MRADHAGDPQPGPAAFPCECNSSFPTLRSRAVHRKACVIWQSLVPADQRPPVRPTVRSCETVPHLLECPALTALRQRHDVVTEAHPPPLSDALHEHKWVAFLRDALALLNPPQQPAEEARH